MSIGTTSLRARPTSSDERLSGETSSRSCEPVMISWVRFAPVNDAPIRAVIAMMPGTNHCSAEPSSRVGQQRREQAEEHQRLHHREQHRHRLAEHRPQLADHHVPGVGDEAGCPELGRTAGRAVGGQVGAWSSISVVMPLLLRSRCWRRSGRWSRCSRAGCARSGRGRRRRGSARRPPSAGRVRPARRGPCTRPGAISAPRADPDRDGRPRPLDDPAPPSRATASPAAATGVRLVGEAEGDQVAEAGLQARSRCRRR